MNITHGYTGMGELYAKARYGTPEFAGFMVANSGFAVSARDDPKMPIHIVEFGVGGGQQTAFVEQELKDRGIAIVCNLIN